MPTLSRQQNLELQIKTYDSNYRAGTPLATDATFDALMEQLKEEYPNSDLLKKGVITQKQSRKQKLPVPMYSLNKCKSIEEIAQWAKAKGLSQTTMMIITPKFDGISLVVDEKTKNCWTRGDGEVGQLSTKHFQEVEGVGSTGDQELMSCGEAIMSKESFKKYKEKYANPRNLVAGLFNRDEPTEPLQDVDFIRYSVDQDWDKMEQITFVNEVFNSVPVHCRATRLKFIDSGLLEDLYEKWSEEYQIDGLVIDVNNAPLRRSLGREENMNPAYAIAYKNPEWSGSAVVKVLGVTWQVSKQGKLKPVIQIEPTEVSGVVISNVTGYNAKYIFDNNIAVGSIIKIIRSGDVIPKHIETISYKTVQTVRLASSLVKCPCCGKGTEWDDTYTELICTNPNCKDKQIAKLTHFFSTLEVEEFGEPSIIRFYNAGYSTTEKILDMSIENMANIEGWGLPSAQRLRKQFDRLVEVGVPFAKMLHAMDFMDGKIGEKTIQLILDHLTFGQIYGIEKIENYKLIEIEGVAEIIANIFIRGMKTFKQTTSLPIEFSYIKSPKQEVVGDKFKDQKICFTGCRPSKELEKEIQSQGGEIVSGVSSKTTILVVKDMNDKTLSSSKAVRAKELGLKVVTLNTL